MDAGRAEKYNLMNAKRVVTEENLKKNKENYFYGDSTCNRFHYTEMNEIFHGVVPKHTSATFVQTLQCVRDHQSHFSELRHACLPRQALTINTVTRCSCKPSIIGFSPGACDLLIIVRLKWKCKTAWRSQKAIAEEERVIDGVDKKASFRHRSKQGGGAFWVPVFDEVQICTKARTTVSLTPGSS